MPNIDSAKKSLRQTVRRTAQNKLRKEAMKNAIKKVIKATSVIEAKKLILAAQKALDKAAKVGTIKKNAASRRLSRLMKKVNKMQ